MAVDAMSKLQTLPAWIPVGPWSVTLGTGDLNVRSRKWKSRLRVIKLADDLPIIRTVTLFTFLPEASLMRIFVTGNACD